MRRRPSNLLVKSCPWEARIGGPRWDIWDPPSRIALVVAAYFVMMCCGLSTGTQRASGILGVWDFPSLPNIVLAFMHSPSVEYKENFSIATPPFGMAIESSRTQTIVTSFGSHVFSG